MPYKMKSSINLYSLMWSIFMVIFVIQKSQFSSFWLYIMTISPIVFKRLIIKSFNNFVENLKRNKMRKTNYRDFPRIFYVINLVIFSQFLGFRGQILIYRLKRYQKWWILYSPNNINVFVQKIFFVKLHSLSNYFLCPKLNLQIDFFFEKNFMPNFSTGLRKSP